MFPKPVRGVEGVVHINDMFGKPIMRIAFDITGTAVPSRRKVDFTGLGVEVNEFMSDHMKLFNAPFSELTVNYEVQQIVFTDGSTLRG